MSGDRLALTNCRLVDAAGERPGPLLIAGGRIAAVGGGPYEGPSLDLGGAIVAPGFGRAIRSSHC